MPLNSGCQIDLLGSVRVHVRDDTQAGRIVTRFRTRATGGLLAYLAYYPDAPHEREKLIELFWPDLPPETGRNHLSVALSALRRVLHPPGSGLSDIVRADRFTVRLHPEGFTTDVAGFRAALAAAKQASRAGDDDMQLRRLDEATCLYRGELLAGFDDEWVIGERFRVAEQFSGALREVVRLYTKRGNVEEALVGVRRLVDADPYREESHRDLIGSLLQSGREEPARRQFLQLRKFLEELGAVPSLETEVLVRHLNIERKPTPKDLRPRRAEKRRGTGEGTTLPGSAVASDEAAHESAGVVPPARSSHLPSRLTRFFGREAEMATVLQWIESGDGQLLTLTGMGGIGKTRLAVEAAAQASDHLVVVAFVALAGVRAMENVPSAIVASLGIPPAPAVPLLDQIVAYLNTQPRTLLILDNMEHLIPPAGEMSGGADSEAASDTAGMGEFLPELLARAPKLQCLVTSRVRLPVPGERVFALAPLPTPPQCLPGSADYSPKQLLVYPSMSLFVDRAQAARADFQITPQNAATLLDLCRLLEGIPLAIELASAWAGALSPTQILGRLGEVRLELLKIRRDQRHVTPRHQSLRAVLSWSRDLLPIEVRTFFDRLSVFRGGWELEAAATVTGAPLALDYLAQLRDASLVEAREEGTSHALRFHMLEITREYAAEQLEPSGTQEGLVTGMDTPYRVKQRHALWCRDLASRAMASGDFTRLVSETDNLHAALEWSLQYDAGLGLAITASLCPFWEQRGLWREGRGWLERALSSDAGYPVETEDKTLPTHRAQALCGHGKISFLQGDFAAASQSLNAGLTLGRSVSDKRSTGTALLHLGILASYQADLETADKLLREALTLHRELGDRGGTASALLNWGIVAGCQGDYHQSRARWEEALALARGVDDQSLLAHALCYLGDNLVWLTELDEAGPVLDEALVISERINLKFTQCYALIGLARLHCLQGRSAQGHELLGRAITLSVEMGADWGLAFALEASGCAAQGFGENEIAAVLWGNAAKLRETIGAPLPKAYADIYEPFKSAARKVIGEAAFITATERGRKMSRPDVLVLERSVVGV